MTTSTSLAFLFPGQGVQGPGMLAGFEDLPQFQHRCSVVGELLGRPVHDVINNFTADDLIRNREASLLTVLVSSLALDAFVAKEQCRAAFVAGYSVGQWAAMYAAEMLDFETLVRIVARRAEAMDRCATTEPGGMLSVIGVASDRLELWLEQLRSEGHQIFLSNHNSAAHYTIAGRIRSIEVATVRIDELHPRKVSRVAVSGAWHCPLMEGAKAVFEEMLEGESLGAPRIPVVDNVTGDWLPSDPGRLRRQLGLHLTNPVLWNTGVRKIVDAGCKRFVELGFGTMLTQFGFFIDRASTFSPFHRTTLHHSIAASSSCPEIFKCAE